jgi:hypothetical protein
MADAWQVTIEGKERKPGYFKWETFATEKESRAYAEGAVTGASIQAGQDGTTAPKELRAIVRTALNGESNDDEHDALVGVAEFLGLAQRPHADARWELV